MRGSLTYLKFWPSCVRRAYFDGIIFVFKIPNVTNVAAIVDQKGVNSASITKIENPSPTGRNKQHAC